MNGGANSHFTALDQYETEQYLGPVAASPSALEAPAPSDETALAPSDETSARQFAPIPVAPLAPPTVTEPRGRSRIGRFSLKLAAVVLAAQAGAILLTIAARQPRRDPSPRPVAPAAGAPGSATSSQMATERTDDQPLPHGRPVRGDARRNVTLGSPSNRTADARPINTPKTDAAAKKGAPAAPAANQVANTTASPIGATLDHPAAAVEKLPEPAPSQAANGTQREAVAPSPTLVEIDVPVQPLRREAELLTFVRPNYPDAAKQSGITGDVEVEMTIDTAGRVVRSLAISGPRFLRGATESALRAWRFRPATVDGTPVSSRRRYLVSFSAPSPDAPEGSIRATEPPTADLATSSAAR